VIHASRFEIHTESQAPDARLTVVGELDLATAPRLQEAVQSHLAQGASSIVIDLGRLTFVDSSGLRLFIVLSDRANVEGWSLGLTRPPAESLSVFQITGAEENLPFIEDPRP
jgi:anti-sigma B factor antagonist